MTSNFVDYVKILVRSGKGGAKIQGRADDNEATINNRLLEYNSKTKPVADYYAAQGKQRVVDGLGSIENIAARIRQAIG